MKFFSFSNLFLRLCLLRVQVHDYQIGFFWNYFNHFCSKKWTNMFLWNGDHLPDCGLKTRNTTVWKKEAQCAFIQKWRIWMLRKRRIALPRSEPLLLTYWRKFLLFIEPRGTLLCLREPVCKQFSWRMWSSEFVMPCSSGLQTTWCYNP